jgi:hypothetical protein
MDRMMYKPTEKQEEKWSRFTEPTMPTDEEFKALWKKAHHGKEMGWGMIKRDWILGNLEKGREYQMGLWQGRVDAIRGLDYSEERLDKAYNVGYHRGYLTFDPQHARREWGCAVYDAFRNIYGLVREEEVAA